MMLEKDCEGSDCGLVKLMSQHFPPGAEENHKNFSKNNGLRTENRAQNLPNAKRYCYDVPFVIK
jgi:hypothetical protein